MTTTLQLIEREVEIPSARVLAAIEPKTFNAQARTFEVVFAAGSVFQRYNWMRDEVYEQQLEMTAQACDLSRYQSGKAPFLLDHRSWSVKDSVAGVIEAARIEGGKGYARVRASGRDELKPILADIADGILCNVSVGADIFESREITEPNAKIRRFLATRWKPFECSLVTIGADEGAVVLSRDPSPRPSSQPQPTHRCTVFFSSEAMPNELQNPPASSTPAGAPVTATQTPAAPVVAAAAPAVDAAQVTAAATAAERNRIAEIQRIGTKLGVNAAKITELVNAGTPLDGPGQARAQLIEAAAAKDDASASTARIQVTREENDGARLAMETFLLNRANPKAHPIDDRAKQYIGCSILDLARHCLRARNLRAEGMTRMEVVTAALQSTSDFPELLANVAKKTLRAGYMNYPSRWRDFVRVVPASDFKPIASLSVGDSPKLTKVTEHGEFTRGKLVESAEKYSVETYGKVLGFTRQAMVNDDLDALTRAPEILGSGAAALVADIVFQILIDNANMADGVALFHATHGNLGVKTLTVAGLDELRTAMRRQTGPNGQKLNVTPKFVLVPPELETAALQLLRVEITPALVASGNPYRGTMDPIVEPRLPNTVWYGAADPAQMDTIQVSFLEGEGDGPMIETRNGFDVDGVEIKVRMDIGAKAVETRGLFKSAGTTP